MLPLALFTSRSKLGAGLVSADVYILMLVQVDYLHPALGGCFGPGCLVGFGYDLVGDAYAGGNIPVPDPDPMDCAGHGSVSSLLSWRFKSMTFFFFFQEVSSLQIAWSLEYAVLDHARAPTSGTRRNRFQVLICRSMSPESWLHKPTTLMGSSELRQVLLWATSEFLAVKAVLPTMF